MYVSYHIPHPMYHSTCQQAEVQARLTSCGPGSGTFSSHGTISGCTFCLLLQPPVLPVTDSIMSLLASALEQTENDVLPHPPPHVSAIVTKPNKLGRETSIHVALASQNLTC